MANFPIHRTSASTLSFLAVLCLPTLSSAQEKSISELMSVVKSGGHVIYIRHAMTESDYADQVAAVLGDCATQRVLSEDGWAQAKSIGSRMASAKIPIESVISSEYCRAWQTADLAFGDYETSGALNFAPTEDYTDADLEQMRAGVVPLLSMIPKDGNAIIVGHDDPFEAATGIYPEPQGVAYIVKPLGDGFEVLGHIDPDEWPNM